MTLEHSYFEFVSCFVLGISDLQTVDLCTPGIQLVLPPNKVRDLRFTIFGWFRQIAASVLSKDEMDGMINTFVKLFGRWRQPSRPFQLSGRGQKLQGVSPNVDTIADRIALLGQVAHLQKVHNVVENCVVGERKILGEDQFFFFTFREINEHLWLQSRVNVLRQFEGAGVVVHGGADAEIGMGVNLDPGDN
jgi:hypothetical protein